MAKCWSFLTAGFACARLVTLMQLSLRGWVVVVEKRMPRDFLRDGRLLLLLVSSESAEGFKMARRSEVYASA